MFSRLRPAKACDRDQDDAVAERTPLLQPPRYLNHDAYDEYNYSYSYVCMCIYVYLYICIDIYVYVEMAAI